MSYRGILLVDGDTPQLTLTTSRLEIRPFVMEDLHAVWQLLDQDNPLRSEGDDTGSFESRRRWLEWTVLNYEQLELLRQPPYGDRAVVLSATGELIGAVGFVPCLGPFAQVWSEHPDPADWSAPEIGLFWQIAPAHRGQGYAPEAAGAMLRYAFEELRLERVIATTDFDNAPSIRVIEKLGMTIYRNPTPKPPWLQVVGVAGGARTRRSAGNVSGSASAGGARTTAMR